MISDKRDLHGTCYFEVIHGKYKHRFWSKESVYFTEESFLLFEVIIASICPHFSHFDITELNEHDTELLLQIIDEFEAVGAQSVDEMKVIIEKHGERMFILNDVTAKELEILLHNKNDDLVRMSRDFAIWIRTGNTTIKTIAVLGI